MTRPVIFCGIDTDNIPKLAALKFKRMFIKHIKISIRSFVFISIILFASLSVSGQAAKKEPLKFPKPEGVKNLLFYVQRTFNTNTLIYTLNANEKEEVDMEEPIKINWINYSKDSSIESLNYIQRKFAYGIDIKIIDEAKKSFSFTFVSYKKKPIYLIKSHVDGKYHAYYQIKNELIILNRLFIQIEGGSFWSPKVKYIEISGVNLKNEKIVERIIP